MGILVFYTPWLGIYERISNLKIHNMDVWTGDLYIYGNQRQLLGGRGDSERRIITQVPHYIADRSMMCDMSLESASTMMPTNATGHTWTSSSHVGLQYPARIAGRSCTPISQQASRPLLSSTFIAVYQVRKGNTLYNGSKHRILLGSGSSQ